MTLHKEKGRAKGIEQETSCGCGGHDHGHTNGESKAEIIKLIIGLAIFALGVICTLIFKTESWIARGVFVVAYIILGGEVVLRAAKNIVRGRIFDENFLMSIATIGAFVLGDFSEAAGVMLFYQVGEYFQGAAVRRSRKSIADLMDIRPDFANVLRNDETVTLTPDKVNPGDTIIVKPGEKIPLDGKVIGGESTLDTKALTGESIPRNISTGDEALSGCVNLNGVLTIKVTKAFGESTASKIIELVENAASRKAPAEKFITKFSRYYTPVVVILAALIAVVPPLISGGDWGGWVRRGLIFLVISCPCALVISIPLSFFGGIGGASKKGVLVKGGNFLEALNNLEVVVFDKTGTLTKGVFTVTKVEPANNFSENELLELTAYAEAFSNHPIALSIVRCFGKTLEKSRLIGYNEISGHGVSVIADGKTILAGNARLMEQHDISFTHSDGLGTKVYTAVDGVFAGILTISDEIKADGRNAVAELKRRGVRKTIMLTGDDPKIAKAVAEELKLDEFYAGLLPGQKVEILEKLNAEKSAKGKLAFIGDGINDAPALARADIGIAMGGLGSDAAIEAADIVLMTDEPSKLCGAVDIARFTKRIVQQNIIFALAVKGAFLLLGAFGVATMWEAVFADVGVALLAVLNATRVMKMK